MQYLYCDQVIYSFENFLTFFVECPFGHAIFAVAHLSTWKSLRFTTSPGLRPHLHLRTGVYICYVFWKLPKSDNWKLKITTQTGTGTGTDQDGSPLYVYMCASAPIQRKLVTKDTSWTRSALFLVPHGAGCNWKLWPISCEKQGPWIEGQITYNGLISASNKMSVQADIISREMMSARGLVS